MPTNRLTRKTFLRMSFGVVAVGVVGCDSDSGDGTDSAASGTTGGTDPSTTGDPPTTGSSSATGDPSTTGTPTTDQTTGSSDSGSDSGSSDSGSTTEGAVPNCGRNGATTQFDIHDHDLEISADMLQPGTALEGLAILGAGHPHSLDLTGEQVDALLAGESVTATSSFGSGHEHQVTVECL